MQAVVDIEFDELVKIVKNLPKSKLTELRSEIEKESKKENNRDNFGTLLLNGPTFSNKQLQGISKNSPFPLLWRGIKGEANKKN